MYQRFTVLILIAIPAWADDKKPDAASGSRVCGKSSPPPMTGKKSWPRDARSSSRRRNSPPSSATNETAVSRSRSTRTATRSESTWTAAARTAKRRNLFHRQGRAETLLLRAGRRAAERVRIEGGQEGVPRHSEAGEGVGSGKRMQLRNRLPGCSISRNDPVSGAGL